MKKYLKLILVFGLILPIKVKAAPTDMKANVSYKGSETISETITISDEEYSSSSGGENALIVDDGKVTINNITLEKKGDEESENSDFYGTNAGLLVYKSAFLTINAGDIATKGNHANAVFSYQTGKVNLNNVTITTSSNNSGGIMVAGGGTINAIDCIVKTSGNSSAAIRSDRGGGTITVNGGSYETDGMGSPSVYSTANITIENADLISNSSEGIVIEGANSVSLSNTKVTDTNNTLNGNSETYKNIFLYQSMSGDADEGIATFEAADSKFTTNNGDTFFVTNTKATINLSNNSFVNNNGDFLRIQSGKWGTTGKNGGMVTMNLNNQEVKGNIIVDSISNLTLNLTNNSVLISSINSSNQGVVDLSLSSNSILSLDGDTYVNSLTNEDTSNSNIYSNGYDLFVNNVKTDINFDVYEESIMSDDNDDAVDTTSTNSDVVEETPVENDNFLIPGIILGVGVISLIGASIFKIKKNKKTKESNEII